MLFEFQAYSPVKTKEKTMTKKSSKMQEPFLSGFPE